LEDRHGPRHPACASGGHRRRISAGRVRHVGADQPDVPQRHAAGAAGQILAMVANNLLSWMDMLYSVLALAPIWAAMPLGAYLAKRMSPAVFDRFILIMLSILAVKLVLDAAL
jgi:hypothetical protein